MEQLWNNEGENFIEICGRVCISEKRARHGMMSIRITFSGAVSKKEEIMDVLWDLCMNDKNDLYVNGDYCEVRVCPLGTINLNFIESVGKCELDGWSITSLVGAGFHKYVVEFLDEFQWETGVNLFIQDDTEYMYKRDFNQLRKEHFYPWLVNLVSLCVDYKQQNYTALNICWDSTQYQPSPVDGYVVSPFGRFNIDELAERIGQGDVESFAYEFYLWNDKKRNAIYYRNCALHRMWEHCYYMPSSRSETDKQVNGQILDDLERCLKMDCSLPFPTRDYQVLCRLDHREAVDVSDVVPLLTSTPIGYRKGWVKISFGNLEVSMPGNFLHEYEDDKNDLWYDGAENWKNMRLQGYHMNNGKADFVGPVFTDVNTYVEEMVCGEARLRYVFDEHVEEGEPFYQAVAQIVCESDLYLMSLCYRQKEDDHWATEVFRRLKGVKKRQFIDDEISDSTTEIYS